ncbi:PepSY-like domain-containing protein [Muribaculum intestinale]|uniref:PepSY-like domain-containing protein n=1 Tax=Muribaculum intestinale TaxID=1796646 RepID=UPI0034E48FA7
MFCGDKSKKHQIKAAHNIIPAAISKFVSTNFSGQDIVEISRKRGGYEIELTNGTELKLTEDAKPLTEQPRRQNGNRPRK